MSKEIFGKKLNAGQRAHIVGGLAENAATYSDQIGRVGGAIRAIKGAASGVASASGGTLLIVGGLFTAIKGYKLMRNASGLQVNKENVTKALDEVGIPASKEFVNEFQGKLKSALLDEGICNKKGFVLSKNRENEQTPKGVVSKAEDIGGKFANAVKRVLEESGQVADSKLVSKMTKSLAQDLGFMYDDKNASLVSYDGRKSVMTSQYKSDDLAKVLGISPKQSVFSAITSDKFSGLTKSLETAGIIDNGRCARAPSVAELSACCAMAGVKVDSDKLEKAVKYLGQKASSVAQVPTWQNKVNANQKMEAGFISIVGLSSVAAGVVALLATFAGIASLAAASFGIAIAGITVASSLVVRDIVNETRSGLKNRSLMKEHQKLKESAITPEAKLEHAMHEKLYESKSRENAGLSAANMMFIGSIAIALLSVLAVLSTGGVGLLALAIAPTFLAGTAMMVGAKKVFAKEVTHIQRDIKEYEGLVKDKAEGKLSEKQEARLSELEAKYQDAPKAGVTDGKNSDPREEVIMVENPIHVNAKAKALASQSQVVSDLENHQDDATNLAASKQHLAQLLQSADFCQAMGDIQRDLGEVRVNDQSRSSQIPEQKDVGGIER